MLELLRDNPLELVDLNHLDYKDGFISGFNIHIESKQIVIGKGLLKHNDKLFKLTEDYKLDIPKESGKYIISLSIKEKGLVKKKKEYDLTFNLREFSTYDMEEHEFFITSFKIQDGTYLRSEFNNFYELSTEYNVINIINQRFSCTDERGTIAPSVMNIFGRELLSKENLEMLDVQFGFSCVNNRMKRESILLYIALKRKKEYKNLDNTEVYNELRDILDDFENNRGFLIKNKRRVMKMIVD